MTRNYVFEGNVMPLMRSRRESGMTCDEYTLTRIKLLNIIDSQHGCDRKFQGRLNLSMIWLLPFPDGMRLVKKQDMDGQYHTNRPTLSMFIRMFEDLFSGVLFDDGSIIVSIQAEKRVSLTPGVEFILTEIE